MTMRHQNFPSRLLLGMTIVILFGAIGRPVAMVHAQGADPKVPLAIDFVGSGTGKVTSTPGPSSTELNCFNDCTIQYNLVQPPTSVTLTATGTKPQGGGVSSFGGWSGSCSGTGSCVVSMSAARSVTATFTAAPVQHTLTVTKNGAGSGRLQAVRAASRVGAIVRRPITWGRM